MGSEPIRTVEIDLPNGDYVLDLEITDYDGYTFETRKSVGVIKNKAYISSDYLPIKKAKVIKVYSLVEIKGGYDGITA